MIIAIDGPAGTGKGTISKIIAERLGFTYIDTGAMYRCIALKMLNNNISPEDIKNIEEMLNNTKIDFKNKIEAGKYSQEVYLDGVNVTDEIRLPKVNEIVSPYSAIPIIREKLVELQRNLANSKDTIMEGRDITTVVLPNADLKIYLTANIEQRARRRYRELLEKNVVTTLEETLESIKIRDYNDINKPIGALKIAEDAIVVDTTNLSIEELYEKLLKLINEKEEQIKKEIT